MGEMKRPRVFNLIIIAWAFSLILDIVYWVLFFFVPNSVQLDPTNVVYMTFEMTFPVADAFLGVMLFVGIIGLWKMRPYGLLGGLLNGGAAVFLGLMDLTYDLQHGVFALAGAEVAAEAMILVITLVLSPMATYYVWKNRDLLLQNGLEEDK